MAHPPELTAPFSYSVGEHCKQLKLYTYGFREAKYTWYVYTNLEIRRFRVAFVH